MSDTLIIVESPKMLARANRVASLALGRQVDSVATVGHLYDLPVRGSGKGWVAINSGVPERVAKAAEGKRHILIASDPDDEGERIAWQAASRIKGNGALVQRIRVASWDQAGFRQGLAHAGFDAGQACRAEARRICDRTIGWQHGAPGRVKAHMMAGAMRNGLASSMSWAKVSPPPNLARVSLAASVLGASVRASTDGLSQAWLNGELSYPRTDGEEYGPDALREVQRLTKQYGFEPFPEPEPGFHGSHEALRPTGPASRDNFILSIVRDMVAHSMARKPYSPLKDEEITGLPNEARWLLAAWRDGVGRPGTWANHIDRLQELGVFDLVHDFYEDRVKELLGQLPESFSDLLNHDLFYRGIDVDAPLQVRIERGLSAFDIKAETGYEPSWGTFEPENNNDFSWVDDKKDTYKYVIDHHKNCVRSDLVNVFLKSPENSQKTPCSHVESEKSNSDSLISVNYSDANQDKYDEQQPKRLANEEKKVSSPIKPTKRSITVGL